MLAPVFILIGPACVFGLMADMLVIALLWAGLMAAAQVGMRALRRAWTGRTALR